MATRFIVACCAAFAGAPSGLAATIDGIGLNGLLPHLRSPSLRSRRRAANSTGESAAAKAQVVPLAIPREAYATVPDHLDERFLTALKDNLINVAGVGPDHIHIFDDGQMAASVCSISNRLEEEGVPGAFEAFAALRPGAFKADLWRYMVLWYHGGVYMDMDLRLKQPVDHWINFTEPKLVLVEDRPPRAYWNALMASPPHHPGLKAIIQAVINHVRSMQYGNNPLDVTGPTAFFSALATTPGIQDSIKVDLKMTVSNGNCGGGFEPVCHAFVIEKKDENDIIAFKEPDSSSSVHGAGHYATLYAKHEIFCGEPGPPCAQLPPCEKDATEPPAM